MSFNMNLPPLGRSGGGVTTSRMSSAWMQEPARAHHPARPYAAPVVVYERVLSSDTHAPFPTHRKRLNSERCKAFRAKKKKHEEALVLSVEQMHKKIGELEIQHAVATERMLQRRNSLNGSLVRVARDLKLFLQHNDVPVTTKQYDMVRCYFSPNALGNTKELFRVKKCLSTFYSRVLIRIQYADIGGTEEAPVVMLHTMLDCDFTSKTLSGLFPHVPETSDIYQRLVGRCVPYEATSHFIFDEDGRLISYESDVDFVGGMYAALGSLEEVNKVLNPPKNQTTYFQEKQAVSLRVEELQEDELKAEAEAEAQRQAKVKEEFMEDGTPVCALQARRQAPRQLHTRDRHDMSRALLALSDSDSTSSSHEEYDQEAPKKASMEYLLC